MTLPETGAATAAVSDPAVAAAAAPVSARMFSTLAATTALSTEFLPATTNTAPTPIAAATSARTRAMIVIDPRVKWGWGGG